jgi:hypothetical protein
MGYSRLSAHPTLPSARPVQVDEPWAWLQRVVADKSRAETTRRLIAQAEISLEATYAKALQQAKLSSTCDFAHLLVPVARKGSTSRHQRNGMSGQYPTSPDGSPGQYRVGKWIPGSPPSGSRRSTAGYSMGIETPPLASVCPAGGLSSLVESPAVSTCGRGARGNIPNEYVDSCVRSL